MAHTFIGGQQELKDCQEVLQHTLDRLDNFGAGIAAIHVNAAIEQLELNLEALEKAKSKVFSTGRPPIFKRALSGVHRLQLCKANPRRGD